MAVRRRRRRSDHDRQRADELHLHVQRHDESLQPGQFLDARERRPRHPPCQPLDPLAETDHIVVYDRATSQTAGLFKRFNLATIGAPILTNGIIKTTTPGGQHLYVSSLLPAGATFTPSAIGNALNPKAQLEPSTHRLVLEDPANPTDVRFLAVFQGTDANAAVDPTALVQSTAGTAFDGALIVDTVVMFKHDMAAPFASVSYSVPDTTVHHYVTGLAPATGYTVATQTAGNTIQVTIALGGSATTDSAGVLTF